MKPYKDIQAMFWSEDLEEYGTRIKELEAENEQLAHQLLQQTLHEIKADLPTDEETPVAVVKKEDVGFAEGTVPMLVPKTTSGEKDNQAGPNSIESEGQFELVRTRKTANVEPENLIGEGHR